MGPFPKFGHFEYILLAVNYISKWVEAKATTSNDSKIVAEFFKVNIFNRFGVPKVLISDQGTYLCNLVIRKLTKKYGVRYKVTTTYHPQTNGQAEVSNIGAEE